MRYFVNLARKLYHDSHYSTERCNLDDYLDDEKHYRSDNEPLGMGLRMCIHCAKQKAKELST